MEASFVIKLYLRKRKISILDLDVSRINGAKINSNPKFRFLESHPVGFICGIDGEDIKLCSEIINNIEADFDNASKNFNNIELHRSYKRLIGELPSNSTHNIEHQIRFTDIINQFSSKR